MKVLVLNHSDISGGAARAAYRIHHALRRSGIDSQMWVDRADAGDWTVQGPRGKWEKAGSILRPELGRMVSKVLRTKNPVLHSPALSSSHWVSRINASDADLVHLHWVNGEMLSIADIGRIRKPIVWTLHDMWAFCGAEHYTEDSRWLNGYTRHNRPSYERGFDLNRWAWRRKYRHWKRPIHVVTPSRWLADCAKKSALMREWSVTVIPNAIDTDYWQPIEKTLARRLLQLPTDVPLLLFGAIGGSRDPRKGFDLLRAAIRYLRGQLSDPELIIFGQLAPQRPPELGFPVHYTGHLYDDLSLRVLYSAADLLIIPSRQDNLPNTGVEALACGTPVVAFDACGLPDIVHHEKTGYLASPFDPEDLASGILWVLGDTERHQNLRRQARDDAINRFSAPVVAAEYARVYQSVID